MSETFGRADMVASWIGPCDAGIKPIFQLSIAASANLHLSQAETDRLKTAVWSLTTRRYWTRAWIQQEVLLQRNVVLFCGEYRQPLYPLITWLEESATFYSCSSTELRRVSRYAGRKRKPTLLNLIQYFEGCRCKDARDKVFALVSLVDDEERTVLMQQLPDYTLNLGQVFLAVLRHVRIYSGQRRLAQQLDSIIDSLVGTGDSHCGMAARNEYGNLRESWKAGRGSTRVVTAEEKARLTRRFALYGEVSWLEVLRCIFGSTQRGGTEVWVLDPALSRAREDFLLGMLED